MYRVFVLKQVFDLRTPCPLSHSQMARGCSVYKLTFCKVCKKNRRMPGYILLIMELKCFLDRFCIVRGTCKCRKALVLSCKLCLHFFSSCKISFQLASSTGSPVNVQSLHDCVALIFLYLYNTTSQQRFFRNEYKKFRFFYLVL